MKNVKSKAENLSNKKVSQTSSYPFLEFLTTFLLFGAISGK